MSTSERRAQAAGIFAVLLATLATLAMTRIVESQPLKTAPTINNWRRDRTEPERVQMYAYNNPIRGTRATQSRPSGGHAEARSAAEASDVLAHDLHMQQLMEQLVELSRAINSHMPMPNANASGRAKLVVKRFDNLRSRYRNVDVDDEPERDPHQRQIANSNNKLNAPEQRLYEEITNSNKDNDKLKSNMNPATAKLDSNETQASVGESRAGVEKTHLPPTRNSYSQEFQLAEKGEKKIVKITTLAAQQNDIEGGRRSNETSTDSIYKTSELIEDVQHQNAPDVVQKPRENVLEPQEAALSSFDIIDAKDIVLENVWPDDKNGDENRNLNEDDVTMTTQTPHEQIEASTGETYTELAIFERNQSSNHERLENLNKSPALKIAKPSGPLDKSIEPHTISNQLVMEDKEEVAPPRATAEQGRSSDGEMTEYILITNDTLNHVSKRQEHSEEVKVQALSSSTTTAKYFTDSSNKSLQQGPGQKLTIKNMTERKNDRDNEKDDSDSDSDSISEDDVGSGDDNDDDDDAMTAMSSIAAAMHSTLINEHIETEADNDDNGSDKEKEEDKEMDIAVVVVDNDDDDNDVDSVDASTRASNRANVVTEARVKEMPTASTNKASTNDGDIALDMSHKRMGLNQSRGTSTLQSMQAHESIQRETNQEEGEEDEANVKFPKKTKQKVAISSYRNVNVRNDESISQDNVTVDETVSPDIFPLSFMPHLSDYVNTQSKFLTPHDKRTQSEVATHLKTPALPKGEANIVWVLGPSQRQKEVVAQVDATPYAGAPRMTEVNSLPEIETTNWWHMLPYTEIRSFLNTIHT